MKVVSRKEGERLERGKEEERMEGRGRDKRGGPEKGEGKEIENLILMMQIMQIMQVMCGGIASGGAEPRAYMGV